MPKEEKKIILVLIIISIVIIGALLIWKNSKKKENENQNVEVENEVVEEYVQHLEDGSKLNISDELQKTKTLDGLEITNIQLKETGGITTLLATVENKTGKATSNKMVKIEIVDKEGNVITDLVGEINAMQKGGTTQLNVGVTADVSNAYDFKISNP